MDVMFPAPFEAPSDGVHLLGNGAFKQAGSGAAKEMVVTLGTPRFCRFSMLNASARSCNSLCSPNRIFLSKEKSMFTTPALLSTLRPKFPKVPEGAAKAH